MVSCQVQSLLSNVALPLHSTPVMEFSQQKPYCDGRDTATIRVLQQRDSQPWFTCPENALIPQIQYES